MMRNKTLLWETTLFMRGCLTESSDSSQYISWVTTVLVGNETETPYPETVDGTETSPGGTYLTINTETATAVNPNNVPTLTCQ